MRLLFTILFAIAHYSCMAQSKVTKCRYYSFTFGNIKFDSVNIRESLTFKGDLIAYNSDKYSLIFFENYTMKMEMVGQDFPIDVEDTLFFDRSKNRMYVFKENKAYPMVPWTPTGVLWKADTATMSYGGKTAYLKKTLPPNVFPMPRVAFGLGIYRYASKKFFLNLQEFVPVQFNFESYVLRVKNFSNTQEEMDTIY